MDRTGGGTKSQKRYDRTSVAVNILKKHFNRCVESVV